MSNTTKTALITGASSGIGLATALYYFENQWNVIATMRHPEERRTPLHEKGLPDLVHLDVTDGASIRAAIQGAVDKYHRIDVVVNNAGYSLYGPFEAITPAQAARQFDTNVFGLMEVTRQVLLLFRQQQSGVLINLASMGGRLGYPLYSIYNSTKWAVEGFSEALQYELRPLNIKVKIIEPGIIQTDFYGRSMDTADCSALTGAYDNILERGKRHAGETAAGTGIQPRTVARTIYQAATDSSWRLRYTVGNDARLVSLLRRLLPDGTFSWVLEKATLG